METGNWSWCREQDSLGAGGFIAFSQEIIAFQNIIKFELPFDYKLENLKQETKKAQKDDNPYMSSSDLMQMTEKEKIVEEMAQAAKIEEALHKEQHKQ